MRRSSSKRVLFTACLHVFGIPPCVAAAVLDLPSYVAPQIKAAVSAQSFDISAVCTPDPAARANRCPPLSCRHARRRRSDPSRTRLKTNAYVWLTNRSSTLKAADRK